jgi:hypothetical protein
MGIRFYCPNGHKLNVKQFQAGQTGFCPTCGAKMQIPLQSTRPSSRQEESRSPGGAAETPPAAASIEPVAADAPAADALSEARDAVWYVRPPSGGQFGPATGNIMRGWLAEGRVVADALVWREGWRDWREAGAVFPQLSGGGAIPGLEDVLAEPIAVPGHSRPLKHHGPPRRAPTILIGILAIALLALVVTILVILATQ